MSILIKNIRQLVQVHKNNVLIVSGKDMKHLPIINDAYLYIEHDTIIEFGSMTNFKHIEADTVIDATGKLVLPAWCDSHTHLVFANNRSKEFVDKINGLTYEEIAKRGGGILNSALHITNINQSDLYKQSNNRLNQCIAMGSGAFEIKTGYGLQTNSELKILRVIAELKKQTQAYICPTLLAAHAIPQDYKHRHEDYINYILNDLIPKAASLKIAKYVDVFCEEGYFSLEDMDRILIKAKTYGLIPKVHVNQFTILGGIEVAVRHNALSVDHLELLNDRDISALQSSDTIPVALPGCSFYLGIPYTPGRQLIDSGLPLAIATDFNPGSAPSGNMNFAISLACIKMKLTPEEAINAATINGAYAMGISNMYGSITRGKKANIIITKDMDHYRELPYYFSHHPIYKVIVNGKIHE